MYKEFAVIVKTKIRLPDCARIAKGTIDMDCDFDHIQFQEKLVRPEIQWLEYHSHSPQSGIPGRPPLWITVEEDAQAFNLNPRTEAWYIEEIYKK